MVLVESAGVLGLAPAPWWFRGVVALVAALPYRALAPLGRFVGWLAGSVLRIRRAHVVAAMRRAEVADAQRTASRMYGSLGVGLMELLWLAGRPAEALDPLFSLDDEAAAALKGALARGRGVVVATAHTGNWDLAACAAARWLARERLAPSLTVVTKRLSNHALDRAWQRLRAERGVTLVDAGGATRAVAASLASGGVVALLVDQAPDAVTRHESSARFLGAVARHHLAPAMLAARAAAPIVMLFGHRDGRGLHRLSLGGTVAAEALHGGRPAHVAATERIAAALDAFVRAHPEQWLWLHRRWK
ncbi:MAG TPA: hypothetical protein VHB21_21495 [Minicystis sp.]|nr:hypothetical protein [Minicystis sp.]